MIAEFLTPLVVSAVITLVLTSITLFVARRTGFTDLQKATMEEGDRLREIQERRIEILEAQVKSLKEELTLEQSARQQVEKDMAEVKELLASNMIQLLKVVSENKK